MSGARFSEDLKPLSPGQRLREAVNVARQNALATLVQESASGRYIRGGPGVRVSTGPQGTTIKLRKAVRPAQGERPGLYVSVSGLTVKVVAATICGVMPTISTTPLSDSPAPTLTITGEGTEYLIATITGTYDVSDSIFVRPAFTSITSVVISVSTTEPDEQELRTDGVHTLRIATFIDGVKTNQNGYGPISYCLQDQFNEAAAAMLVPYRTS